MNRRSISLGAALLGVALVGLGLAVTPGIVSRTAATCSSYGPSGFRGVDGAFLVWDDGCNDWFVSVPAVAGVGSLAVAVCSGLAVVPPRVRGAVASGR
ncbi:hypothetical protein [Halosimplex marinum]|uniref:hypothetical protein n=1 Tax=Halosimplex marinum TaxID=3396620 RepID=UPI003F561D06